MEHEIVYPGIALNETLTNGKIAGRIILTGHSVRFEYEGGLVEFALQDLSIRRGGSSSYLVFLEHPAHPGWSLYTEKKSILRELKQLSKPDLSGQVSDIRKSRLRVRGTILAVLIIIGLIFLALLQLRNPIARAIASSIPAEWEQSLGESVFAQYKAERQVITDPGIVEAMQRFTAPLLVHIPQKRYAFHIYIVADPSINAFALPGGFVVLHTGLLLNAEQAEEVLGVLAHEIAHVTQQHGLRKMIDSLGFFLIIKAFLGDRGGLLSELLEGGAFLLDQKFSRSFEREADENGFAYLVGANIDPTGMIGFFRRLHEKSKDDGALSINNALNFLSTHPAPDERMEYLQKKWRQLNRRGGFLRFGSDYKVFRETLEIKLGELQPSDSQKIK
jgi:Zn-dependent protease with chaperone function